MAGPRTAGWGDTPIRDQTREEFVLRAREDKRAEQQRREQEQAREKGGRR